VTGCEKHNVAMAGADPEHKWCLEFRETDKPLVLNMTNMQLCAKVFGSEDTDDWTGKPIVLYTDPNVSYGGKIVGGIRVRAPKPGAKLPEPVQVEAPSDDDIPF
jgi:hypothetical protein